MRGLAIANNFIYSVQFEARRHAGEDNEPNFWFDTSIILYGHSDLICSVYSHAAERYDQKVRLIPDQVWAD